jgi:V/A-type H+-transporting ATPase subunit C
LPSAKYAFMSAYLKGAESKVLTSEHIDRMSRVSSVPDVVSNVREVLEIVKDTDAGRYLEEALVKTFDDSDRYLWHYFSDCLERLGRLKLVPEEVRRVLTAYMVKYDVINIKAALQATTAGRKARIVPVGIIHNQGLLDELSRAEAVSDVIGVLRECRMGDYADILTEYSAEDKKSRFLTEAKLDGVYYDNLLRVSRHVPDGALLAKAFSIIIDMTNLALVSRALVEEIGSLAGEVVIKGGYMISDGVARELLEHKLADLPSALGIMQYREIAEEIVAGYGRTKTVTVVEETVDRHRFQLLRDMLSPRVLTPLVLAWYLVVKELEVRNLRLIFKATFDGIPVEEIREYLVSA